MNPGPPEKTLQLNADITTTKQYVEDIRRATNHIIDSTTRQEAELALREAAQGVRNVESMLPNLTYVDGDEQWGRPAHIYFRIAQERFNIKYPDPNPNPD